MFVWTSIAHMALLLREAGINEIPNESVALSAMHSSIGETTGLYVFPGRQSLMRSWSTAYGGRNDSEINERPCRRRRPACTV